MDEVIMDEETIEIIKAWSVSLKHIIADLETIDVTSDCAINKGENFGTIGLAQILDEIDLEIVQVVKKIS